MKDQHRIRDLLDRLGRLAAAEDWNGNLNPTQMAALSYLARANRFSRAPSHVADYLSATRGTISQTLKALARKGLIDENRSETDKRWISYELTNEGRAIAATRNRVDDAVAHLSSSTQKQMEDGLTDMLRTLLADRGNRAFGICGACKHHEKRKSGGFCALLQEPLSAPETKELCHEFEDAA